MKNYVYENKTLFIPDRYYHTNLTNRFQKKIYEKEEVYLCKKHFNKNDNVLELGSCLGFVTSILSDQCNYVASIEANPELKECLNETKKANIMNNVEFLHGYLSTTKTKRDFQTYDNVVAGSGDREDLVTTNIFGYGHTLKTYLIDTILINEVPKYETINALVMDIEGGELDFLNNFESYISKNIKKICIEIHGFLMKNPNFEKMCVQKIKDMGFKLIEKVGITFVFYKQ